MNAKSIFPKQMDTGRIVVPHVSLTDIATVDCEVLALEVQNSTNATISLTVSDKQGTPRKLLDAIPIDPNTIYTIEWNNGQGKCASGVSWQATATGLYARLTGFKHANETGIIRS